MRSEEGARSAFANDRVALNHSCRLVPLLVISALSMLSCADDSPTAPSVGSIIVSPSSATLSALGDTTRFQAAAQDGNGNTMAVVSFTWSSSSRIVATVDGQGLATAKGAGEALIIASASGMADTALLVVDQQVASVTISPDTARLTALGETTTFEAAAQDANSHALVDASFTWTSAIEY